MDLAMRCDAVRWMDGWMDGWARKNDSVFTSAYYLTWFPYNLVHITPYHALIFLYIM